jgi:hypothetical protein
LSLSQGLQLQHAVLVMNGARTVATVESGIDEYKRLEALING